MIIKCVRGDYFPGLIDYIMRWGQYAASGEIPRVLEHRGIFHPKTAAAQLWDQASLAPDRTRRAVHLIARAERGLTDAQYRDLGERMLIAAGLEKRPFILVLHDDDGHLHLATVEVDENGKPPPRRQVSRSLKREVDQSEAKNLPAGDVVSRSWDSHLAWQLTKVSRQVEIDFGLRRLGLGLNTFDKIRIPTWQLKKENEEGLIPLAKSLGHEIQAALDLPTWNERSDALAQHGLGLRPYAGPNKKRQGLQVYALGEPAHFCNGSELGKAFGLGTLEKRSDGPFRDWYATQVLVPEGNVAAQTFRVLGKLQGDQQLVRLKAEYDALIQLQRKQRAERKGMLDRHKIERKKDTSIVRLLQERLAATANVSKTWIRTLCQIARAILQAKTRARHLVELASANTWPKRQLKWPEFLASRAASDPSALRIFDQVRQNLSIEERLREIEDAKAAEEERSRAVLEAQAAAAQEQARVDAAFAAAQLELSNEIAKEQNERIRDISHLVGRCVIHMRSSDDRDSLLSYLDKKGDKETLDALLDADRRDYVEAWLGSAVRNQKYFLTKFLRYIEASGDSGFTKDGRIDHRQIGDDELRAISYSTADWPEVKAAVRGRVVELKRAKQRVTTETNSKLLPRDEAVAEAPNTTNVVLRDNPMAAVPGSIPSMPSESVKIGDEATKTAPLAAPAFTEPSVTEAPPPQSKAETEQETGPDPRPELDRPSPVSEKVTEVGQQNGQVTDRDDQDTRDAESTVQSHRGVSTQPLASSCEAAVVPGRTRSSMNGAVKARRKPKSSNAAVDKARGLARQRAEAKTATVDSEAAVTHAADDTKREAPPDQPLSQDANDREVLAAPSAETGSIEDAGIQQPPADLEPNVSISEAPPKVEGVPPDHDADELRLQWEWTKNGGKSRT